MKSMAIDFSNKSMYILLRATSGIRRHPLLHLFSIITLCAAFLSFTATLTAAINLNNLIDQWTGNAEMSVYLKPHTTAQETEKLIIAIKDIEGVKEVTLITQEDAKKRFTQDLSALGDIEGVIPPSVFPISLDIHLLPQLSEDKQKRHELADRLKSVQMIEDVEVYDDWFDRLTIVSTMGKTAAWGLGLLALIVSVLVVAATVKTGVSARRTEIMVMRYVGATKNYVRLPFLLEGAATSTLAMSMALFLLNHLVEYVNLIASSIMPLFGSDIIRLTNTTFLYLLLGGLVAGLIGARISLRKLEDV